MTDQGKPDERPAAAREASAGDDSVADGVSAAEGAARPPVNEGAARPPADQGAARPPADQGAARPPADQGAARPPVGEGATVPLKPTPAPPGSPRQAGGETPTSGPAPFSGPTPAGVEQPAGPQVGDEPGPIDDEPTRVGPFAAGPGAWPPRAVDQPAAAPRPAEGSRLPAGDAPLSGDAPSGRDAPLSGDAPSGRDAPLSGDGPSGREAPLGRDAASGREAPLSGDAPSGGDARPGGASAAEADDWFSVDAEPQAGAPAAEEAWRQEDDEVTTRLSAPAGGPAVDDEPTVERPNPVRRPQADDDGPTRPLRPPVIVPGRSSDTPGIDDPAFPTGDDAPAGRVTSGPVPDTTGDTPDAGPDAAGDGSFGIYAAQDDPDRAGDDPDGSGPGAVSPDEVTAGDGGRGRAGGAPGVPAKGFQKFLSAGVLIWVLLALFGFTLVVQLRSNNSDEGLASARQDDLVRILSDLEARDTRLQAEIAALETSQRQLTSGVAGRQAALAEAEKRAAELGLLAGTLAGTGPGLEITVDGVRASAVLNAVQELRGAGGEVMQLTGANGAAVRIVASTYFVDAEGGGLVADGKRLTGPYRLVVIGVPQTMQTALEIPGGVVASVKSGGGSVTMEQRNSVEVTALREATSLQYARPVS